MATGSKAMKTLLFEGTLEQDRETKGTFRFTAENPLTGRDVSFYIEKANIVAAGIDPPDAIKVTVEAV